MYRGTYLAVVQLPAMRRFAEDKPRLKTLEELKAITRFIICYLERESSASWALGVLVL